MINEYNSQDIPVSTEIWLKEFMTTNFYELLDSKFQRYAHFAVTGFVEYMSSFQGVAPAEWSATDATVVCLDVLPRKVNAEPAFFDAVAPVLEAFFYFLADKGYVREGQRIGKKIASLQHKIVANAANPAYWGMAKTIMMRAQEEGIDPGDSEQMKLFFDNYNNQLMQDNEGLPMGALLDAMSATEPYRNPNKTGRNEICPCGSGKKYKKCCLGQSDRPFQTDHHAPR